MVYRISSSVSDELGLKIEEIVKRYSISKAALIALALSKYIYENYDLQNEVMDMTTDKLLNQFKDEIADKVAKKIMEENQQ